MQREVLKLISQAVRDAVASEVQRSHEVELEKLDSDGRPRRDRDSIPSDTSDEW